MIHAPDRLVVPTFEVSAANREFTFVDSPLKSTKKKEVWIDTETAPGPLIKADE